MAKALIGYVNSDLRDPRQAVENARLRARVAELETLVLRLTEENDKLVAARAADIELAKSWRDHRSAAGDAARLRLTRRLVLDAGARNPRVVLGDPGPRGPARS